MRWLARRKCKREGHQPILVMTAWENQGHPAVQCTRCKGVWMVASFERNFKIKVMEEE